MWIKLNDLKGKAVREFPQKIMSAVENIIADEDAVEIFLNKEKPDDIELPEWAAMRYAKSRVALFGKHADDLAVIFAANANMTVDEWDETITMESYEADLIAMVSDPRMRNFFVCAQMMKQTS